MNTEENTLAGKKVLITGASSGIGEATAKEFAKRACDVALTARRRVDLQELAERLEEQYKGSCLVAPVDVREEAQVKSMIDKVVDAFRRIDVLVNNAGIMIQQGEIEELPSEDFVSMSRTNIDGTYYTTRAALPHIYSSQGKIVFIGSASGKFPAPYNPVYAASKWWVRGFAHSLEGRVGAKGVGVSVINPTAVRTELGGESGKPAKDRFQKGEAAEPEEIARAVAFAASQTNSTVSELDLFRRDRFSDF